MTTALRISAAVTLLVVTVLAAVNPWDLRWAPWIAWPSVALVVLLLVVRRATPPGTQKRTAATVVLLTLGPVALLGLATRLAFGGGPWASGRETLVLRAPDGRHELVVIADSSFVCESSTVHVRTSPGIFQRERLVAFRGYGQTWTPDEVVVLDAETFSVLGETGRFDDPRMLFEGDC